MLTEEQCGLLEKGLTENVEPRKVAAYLCLHMGLTLAEVAALRPTDIDLAAGQMHLRHTVASVPGGPQLQPMEEPRTLPLPSHVRRYLSRHLSLYPTGDCFLLTGESSVPLSYPMQNVLTGICQKYKVADKLSASDLRAAFIRRCIQEGVDLYSLCAYIGMHQPRLLINRYKEYFLPDFVQISHIEKYASDYQ